MFSFSSPFDAELAARLNEVPVPADLLVRLRNIPVASDADLDAALLEVPVPSGLSGRLMTATQRDRRWPALFRQAVAAVVVFTVSLAYALSVVAFVNARFEQLALAGESSRPLAAALDRTEPLIEQASGDMEAPLIELDSLASEQPASLETVAAMAPHFVVAFSSSLPLWSLGEFDRLPIERPAIRLANGSSFDTTFWRQTGVLPWVAVSREPLVEAPLAAKGTGYRLLQQELASGRLLPPSAIRIEDILAGIDYGPASHRPSKPTVTIAAAPSPFAQPFSDADSDGVENRWLVMLRVVMPERQADEGGTRLEVRNGARLAIEFAADRVQAYRVIGYGPPHIGGQGDPISEGEVEADRGGDSADESAVVLCEIQLAAGYDKTAELARVLVKDNDASSISGGRAGVENAGTLRADDFAADFDAAPLIWQQAALVALAAEQLAGSPFADVSFAEIATRARQIEPCVYDRAGWREFIEMLAAAQSARGSLLRAF